jgi:hypothetical protein
MKWTISYIPECNAIHIESEGMLTVEGINQMVQEAMDAGERHGTTLLLVDHRKASLGMSVLNTFERPEQLEKIGFPRSWRVAQVFSEADIETFRFFETVTHNRGYQIRIFTDISLAREWLCS